MILLYEGFSNSAFDFLNGDFGFFKQLLYFLKNAKVPVIGISFWSLLVGFFLISVLGVCLNKIFGHGVLTSSEASSLRSGSSSDSIKKTSSGASGTQWPDDVTGFRRTKGTHIEVFSSGGKYKYL